MKTRPGMVVTPKFRLAAGGLGENCICLNENRCPSHHSGSCSQEVITALQVGGSRLAHDVGRLQDGVAGLDDAVSDLDSNDGGPEEGREDPRYVALSTIKSDGGR